LKKIAVTGGLASGKSSVCHFLQKLGAYVVSADQIVHTLLNLDSSIGRSIVEIFGSEVVVDGQLDRALIAQIAFHDEQKLAALERLTHPWVREEINQLFEGAERDGSFSLFVVEVPLLFEAEMEDLFDDIVAVQARASLCQERFGDEDQYRRRMERQIPMDEKEIRADFVVTNEGSLEQLEEETKAVFNALLGD